MFAEAIVIKELGERESGFKSGPEFDAKCREVYEKAREYALQLGVPLMIGLAVIKARKTPADVLYADTDSVEFR